MSWWSRLRHVLEPGRLDSEIAEEIEDHLARRAASLAADGLDPLEARRRAAVAFGSVARVRDESREVRMSTTLDQGLQDARYAWRGMRRHRAFTATAVVSLSLAIGGLTAAFGVVDAALLRSLPVPDADRLVTLAVQEPSLIGATPGERDTFSHPLFEDLRAAAGDTARLALFSPQYRVEMQPADPTAAARSAATQFVSSGAFEVLRIRAAAGRLFSSDDDRTGGVPPAVISDDFWHSHFGREPSAVGQVIRLDGRAFRIAGVASDGFFGVEPGKFVDVWLPVTAFDPGALTTRAFHWASIVGRLGNGETVEALDTRLRPAYRDDWNERRRASAGPLGSAAADPQLRVLASPRGVSGFRRGFARALWTVWGIGVGILLIACANLATLLLARARSRAIELAVRAALGAGRPRIARQLLTENLLLWALGGAGGWVVASVAAPLLAEALSTGSDPIRLALAMDGRVLVFYAGVCLLAGASLGVLPAWHMAAAHSAVPVAAAGIAEPRARIGRAFLGGQIAFAFGLLVPATAFVFSLGSLLAVRTGFDARDVSVLTVSGDRQLGLPQLHELRRRLGEHADVAGVAAGWWSILQDNRRMDGVIPPGRTTFEREEIFYRVSPGYLVTLRTPLLAGRDFTPGDTDAVQPVATIVNLAFAQRYFAGLPVLGSEFRRADGTRHVVVGLAGDACYTDLRHANEPVAYFPMKPPRRFALYVRSKLGPAEVTRLVDVDLAAAATGSRVVEATTLETLVANTIVKERLLAGIGGVLAAVGLALAAIGLFGVVSYSVSSRTKEFGIRAALGADRLAIVRLALGDLAKVVASGLALGLAFALALTRYAASLLFGIESADPAVIATATALFVTVAAAAALLPAFRAATIDPSLALRND